MRQKIIIANWKEYLTTQQQVEDFCNKLKESYVSISTKEIVILPPYVFIPIAKEILKNTVIKIGAQNLSDKTGKKNTGEISVDMLKTLVQYDLIGHSEVRKNEGDTDKIINQKIKKSLENEIKPILCVGEDEKAYKSKSLDMVLEQVENGLAGVDQNQAKNITIAYEPVWAIGVKNPAAADYVNNMCGRIRVLLSTLFNRDVADIIRILYGGSINPQNAGDFSDKSEIDGLLVGRSSAEIKEFLEVIKEFK